MNSALESFRFSNRLPNPKVRRVNRRENSRMWLFVAAFAGLQVRHQDAGESGHDAAKDIVKGGFNVFLHILRQFLRRDQPLRQLLLESAFYSEPSVT